MAVSLIRFEALPASLTGSHPERAETVDIPTENSPQECSDLSTALKKRSEQVSPLRNNCKTNDFDSILATGAKKANDQSKSKGLNQTMSSCYDNAPDGGWGWVVTFSAFMVGVLLDGIPFSFGLFFKELLDHFSATKSQTSWIISVLNGTYLAIGPIVSVFVGLFGCRKVAIFGASLAAISFFASTWSPNVEVMIVLFGLLGGAGRGLLNLPAIVSVGHYFTSKRALATGIAVCGSGIGALVFAPLSEFLLNLYGWQGAMWILAAIVLNGIPIAALLRPLEGSGKTFANGRGVKYKVNIADNDLTATASKEQVIQDRKMEQTTCCNIRVIFDFELLRSPTFLVYGCSCFLCMLAVFSSLRSIIMVELLGIERLTSSFGLVTMCQGLSAFIGSPIAGALSDLTGDYVGAFYFAGVAIALSGAICFPLRWINAWERRRSRSSNANDFTDISI